VNTELELTDGEIDYSKITVEQVRAIFAKEGSYYPQFEESDNPYRDGYYTDPPKKPRASYLFFQCAVRPYFMKKHPGAPQSELMVIMGDIWKTIPEEYRKPFEVLATEESKRFQKEKILMEKAQKPNEVWQPLRRCKEVLDRLMKDSFAEIFLEPVDTTVFSDYLEIIDVPMDLGTVRSKLENKKYPASEQFARDMRRVSFVCRTAVICTFHCSANSRRYCTLIRICADME